MQQGKQTSCGCRKLQLTIARSYKHGCSRSPEFTAWANMKQRCGSDRNRPSYHCYGGRGITVCDEWRDDFAAFLRDMGPRPSAKFSIDRIDVNGNYEPANCRWATRKIQAQNTQHSADFPERILNAVPHAPEYIKWAELANTTKISRPAIFKHMRGFIREGQVRHLTRGVYQRP